MREESASYCRLKSREHDPDTYLAALFAKPELRGTLWALDALAAELAHVPLAVKEPLLGEIRLQWWRDALARMQEGRADRHPVIEALAETSQDWDEALLMRLIDAQAQALYAHGRADEPALLAHVGGVGGGLLRLKTSRVAPTAQSHAAIEPAGLALGLAAVLRRSPPLKTHGRNPLSTELLARLPGIAAKGAEAAKSARIHFNAAPDPALLPLLLPLKGAEACLRAYAASDGLAEDKPLYRRQLGMLLSALRGRL